MHELLRAHADAIIASSIEAVKPDEAVARALKSYHPHGGKTLLVAAGKAAWQMAAAAAKVLPKIDGGVVVTKYGHVLGDIPGVVCCEGGHPVPDEGSFAGTRKALAHVANLTAEDSVIFLLSGGLIVTGPTGTNVNDVAVLLIGGDAVPASGEKEKTGGTPIAECRRFS